MPEPSDLPTLLIRLAKARPGVWEEVEALLERLINEDEIEEYGIEVEGSGAEIR